MCGRNLRSSVRGSNKQYYLRFFYMLEKKQTIVKISIPQTHTIRQAMETMTRGAHGAPSGPAGIVLVVDSRSRLLGIATDGDIRRAIERGSTLETPIASAMNKTPFLIFGTKSNAEILAEVMAKIKKEGWAKDKIRNIILADEGKRVHDIISFSDLWRNSEVRFKQIGVIGLGYVGLTLGLTLADHGFQVKGYDADLRVRSALKKRRAHFFEIGLPELLNDHLGKNFEVVDRPEGVHSCDVYIISVGTPVDSARRPITEYFKRACRMVGGLLRPGAAVVLRSTVPVGTTRKIAVPILEKASFLKAGKDFYIAFAPERTVEGKALEELRRLPQVIGGIDRVSAEVAAHLFNSITSHSVIVDSLEEAEMVKLVNNTYRDVTFAFANELSLVCRRWGLDAAKIIDAANRDYERSRVPMPSPGVGGYCLKKDPYIFIASARKKGYTPLFAAHARRVSDRVVSSIAESIFSFLRRNKRPLRKARVCLVGLAFKGDPVTSDMRGSTAVDLAEQLRSNGITVSGYDPAVSPHDVRSAGIGYAANAASGFRRADAVVVMNNNPAFRTLNMRKMLAFSRKPVLFVDGWRMYPREEIEKVGRAVYLTL